MSAIAATAVLLVMAVPVLKLHTAQSGLDALPKSAPTVSTIKQDPGRRSRAASIPRSSRSRPTPTRPRRTKAIAELKRQALASGQMHGPITVDVNPAHTVVRVAIPLDGQGHRRRLERARSRRSATRSCRPRSGTIPGATYGVTGGTAASADANSLLKRSAPLVFGFVLTFAFILLLLSFRSIVIAIKAIVLNLLSVGAAYGVLVATFQFGWGENILNFQSNGGIAFWLPIFMFVILFGLSMDYHVFILSRVREAYDRGMSTEDAVAHGIKTTAGVVSSAAIVMVGVFAIFATLPIIDMKEMGIGLAAAVLIDATIVRAVLLPATMKLLGDWNWYLPTLARVAPADRAPRRDRAGSAGARDRLTETHRDRHRANGRIRAAPQGPDPLRRRPAQRLPCAQGLRVSRTEAGGDHDATPPAPETRRDAGSHPRPDVQGRTSRKLTARDVRPDVVPRSVATRRAGVRFRGRRVRALRRGRRRRRLRMLLRRGSVMRRLALASTPPGGGDPREGARGRAPDPHLVARRRAGDGVGDAPGLVAHARRAREAAPERLSWQRED